MRPRLDSRALELFVAVAEALSFRQAAQVLHLSQPPLSRAIRALEERLGTRLFERDTRAVALTEAGQRLLPRARRILRLLKEAEADVAADSTLTTLRLGLTTAVQPAWYDGLAQRIAGAARGVSVQTVFATSPRLVQQLRRQRLQAAVIALPTAAPGLEVQEIERHPMCVALPSAHRLARRRRLVLADLAELPLFLFERARQPAFFDHWQQVFRQHGFVPRATLREPDDHHVLLAEVAAGRGAALLPAPFRALRRPGVAYRALVEGEALGVGVGLAVPPGRPELQALLRRAMCTTERARKGR